jgi:hypothetical protein
MNLSSRYLLLALIALLVTGCAESLPMHREIAALPSGPLCRIAVLPFQNDSDFPLGDVLLQKVFAAQLLRSGDHLVIQEGEIVKAYQQLHLLPGVPPGLDQLQVIADRVNAQLLLTGIALEMREDRSDHQTVNPMIILEVQLRDATTGEALWTTFHRRKGTDYKKTMHFGTIHTLTGLSRQMAEEIFNLWYKKGFAQCKG